MKKRLIIFSSFLLIFSISAYGKLELVGPLSKEEILKKLPEWQEIAASYFPKQEIIEKLKLINYEIKIEVFLGTWCPDCKEHVSAYFKVMEMVDNPLIHTTYTGIPRDIDSRQQFIQGKNILRIPTFIVLINNQEKGRIIETPSQSIEEDLLDIIESKKKKTGLNI